MVGDHVAAGDHRLGIALLPPGIERQGFSREDHAGLGDFAGAEAARGRRLDMVERIAAGHRLVDDIDAVEAEFRPRIDHDSHIHRIGQIHVRRQIGRLLPADADAHRAAVMAFIVERRDDAPVITTCLGEKPRRARCRLGLVGHQRRGIAHDALERAGRIDHKSDGIGLRIGDHRVGIDRIGILEQLEPENFECSNGGRGHAGQGGRNAQGANTRYQTRDMQWTSSRPLRFNQIGRSLDCHQERKDCVNQTTPTAPTLACPRA